MLYKIPPRKPRMSEQERVQIALLALVGIPFLLCSLITLFV